MNFAMMDIWMLTASLITIALMVVHFGKRWFNGIFIVVTYLLIVFCLTDPFGKEQTEIKKMQNMALSSNTVFAIMNGRVIATNDVKMVALTVRGRVAVAITSHFNALGIRMEIQNFNFVVVE